MSIESTEAAGTAAGRAPAAVAGPSEPGAELVQLPKAVIAVRAAARLSKGLEVALSELNISLPQYRLLAFLSGGPERATALAEWLEVSPPSLTALVDGAVNRGLVERVTLPEDRRCVRHVITGEGHAALRRADDALAGKLGDLLGRVPAAHARKIIEGLELLGRALDEARGEAR